MRNICDLTEEIECEEKGMGKKVLIGIAVVVQVIVFVFVFFLAKDMVMENKLKQEITTLKEDLKNFEPDYEKIHTKLKRTISSGDYARLERSLKRCLGDRFETYMAIEDAMDDPMIIYALSAGNYLDDGPDFPKTREKLSNLQIDMITSMNELWRLESKGAVMLYMDPDMDSYYADLYWEWIADDIIAKTDLDTLQSGVDDIVDMINGELEVIEFLRQNKGQWEVHDGHISFITDELGDRYDELSEKVFDNIDENEDELAKPGQADGKSEVYKKEFGQYTVADGWTEKEEYSRDGKYVYAEKDSKTDGEFNNFVVGVGENPYSVEEHETFRNQLAGQLSEKLKTMQGASLNATGSHTSQGYILYTFEITEADQTKLTQYYIVGDKKYCLIAASTYDGSEECDKVALETVNSFTWEN